MKTPMIIKRIKTSKGFIKFNVFDFIKEVEKKPVLWDKTNIDHKNDAINNQNWHNLAKLFGRCFNKLKEDEKTEIVEELKTYWNNLKINLAQKIYLHKKNKGDHIHYFHYMEFYLKSQKKKCLRDFATEEEIQALVEYEMRLRADRGLPAPQYDNDESPCSNDTSDEIPKKQKKVAESSTNHQPKNLKQKQSMKKNISAVRDKCESTSQCGAEDGALPAPEYDNGKRPRPNDTSDKVSKRQKQVAEITNHQPIRSQRKQSINKNTAAALDESYFDPMLVCESVSQCGGEGGGLPASQYDNGKMPRPNDTSDEISKEQKQVAEISTNQKPISLKQKQSINKNTTAAVDETYFNPMLSSESIVKCGAEDENIGSPFDYRRQQQRNNSRVQKYWNGSGISNNLDLPEKSYDAHQAFFDSVKPTLRKLNDSQKLDFKIDVLKTLRKFNNN